MKRKSFTGAGLILSAGWEKGVLEVELTSGGVYRFHKVSERVWKEFLASREKTKYFATRLRGWYREGDSNAPAATQEQRTKADAYKD